jgi:CDP-glycerol glycerophosphotransferase
MPNPYNLLARCDYFVLSSLHEGFGLVIAEADILGKPVISTDIEGPRTFMKKNGGTLVENSENGNVLGVFVLKKRFAIFRCSVATKSPNRRFGQISIR